MLLPSKSLKFPLVDEKRGVWRKKPLKNNRLIYDDRWDFFPHRPRNIFTKRTSNWLPWWTIIKLKTQVVQLPSRWFSAVYFQAFHELLAQVAGVFFRESQSCRVSTANRKWQVQKFCRRLNNVAKLELHVQKTEGQNRISWDIACYPLVI